MIKHLITSGCSFSDNCGKRWPHYLAEALGAELYNRGQGSCGNDWISKSAIYEVQRLLDAGIDPKEMLVVVMWSGIDRKGLFISNTETPNYKTLINSNSPNPVNFIDGPINTNLSSNQYDGYLSGSMNCTFNADIVKLKKELIRNFFNDEALAIESYENFLRLQWFCKSNNIQLINQTFMDIMHYPRYINGPLTKDHYRNIKPLNNMLDYDRWVFWKNTGGLYEYVRDNSLGFYTDNVHPLPESHKHYVDNFLLQAVRNRIS